MYPLDSGSEAAEVTLFRAAFFTKMRKLRPWEKIPTRLCCHQAVAEQGLEAVSPNSSLFWHV